MGERATCVDWQQAPYFATVEPLFTEKQNCRRQYFCWQPKWNTMQHHRQQRRSSTYVRLSGVRDTGLGYTDKDTRQDIKTKQEIKNGTIIKLRNFKGWNLKQQYARAHIKSKNSNHGYRHSDENRLRSYPHYSVAWLDPARQYLKAASSGGGLFFRRTYRNTGRLLTLNNAGPICLKNAAFSSPCVLIFGQIVQNLRLFSPVSGWSHA
jgi:hypothetical protein